MSEQPAKAQIIQAIERLQKLPKFNPDVMGCGVSIWALSGEFGELPPEYVAITLKNLCEDGEVIAIDPDAQGLVSFIVPNNNQ